MVEEKKFFLWKDSQKLLKLSTYFFLHTTSVVPDFDQKPFFASVKKQCVCCGWQFLRGLLGKSSKINNCWFVSKFHRQIFRLTRKVSWLWFLWSYHVFWQNYVVLKKIWKKKAELFSFFGWIICWKDVTKV